MLFDRVKMLVIDRARTLVAGAEHHRNRGAVDVRVHQADAEAQLRERDREIGGDRRLADSALAAAHRDDVLRSRQPYASSLLAEFRFDATDAKLDIVESESMANRLMDSVGKFPHQV